MYSHSVMDCDSVAQDAWHIMRDRIADVGQWVKGRVMDYFCRDRYIAEKLEIHSITVDSLSPSPQQERHR